MFFTLLKVNSKNYCTKLILMPNKSSLITKNFSINCKCLKLKNQLKNNFFFYINVRYRASYYQDKGIKKAIR